MSVNQSVVHRYREVAVKTANPLQLVVMLYDAAINALQEAQEHIKRKDIGRRSRSLNRCMAILSQLQACLNFKEGGEVASHLDRLYDYMRRMIFKANVEQSAVPLAEVVVLLKNLRSAWSELAVRTQAPRITSGGSELSNRGLPNSENPMTIQLNSLNISG